MEGLGNKTDLDSAYNTNKNDIKILLKDIIKYFNTKGQTQRNQKVLIDRIKKQLSNL